MFEWLTSADEEVLDGFGLGHLVLVKSKDVELRDIVHVDRNANLGRRGRVSVSGQEIEEDGVGAIVELFWSVRVDVAPENVPEDVVSIPFVLAD